MIGFYDYTVILTYCGMISAFAGILNAINGNYRTALICLMFTGLCDMFDGTVASTKKSRNKKEKRFGIQIDSLSDLISFGVLPAVFVYMYSGKTFFSGAIAAVYTLLALIRLSYFNVDEEERQDNTRERRSEYLGVPVTTVALLLPLVYLLYKGGLLSNTLWINVIFLMISIFFVLAVKVKKPHVLGKIMVLLLGIFEMALLIIIK